MKRRCRRYFAALLAAMMLLALLPAAALAEEETLPAQDGQTADETGAPSGDGEAAPAPESTETPDTGAASDPENTDAPAPDDTAAPTPAQQVQALVDALPEAGDITGDNRADVEAQLSAIDEKKLSLTDGERAMLDMTRYNAAVSAILALDGQAGADVPTPIDYINGFEWTFDGTDTVTLTGEGELNLSGERFPFGVTKIIVNGATSIGEGCFKGRTELQSITLSDSVTTIGKDAFDGCTYLRQLRLPAGVTSIGENAFSSCDSLTLAELPASLQVIGKNAFDDCYKLVLTEIPDGVTTIEDFAFDFCKGLTHLTLPASLTSMGYCVFQGCEKLTSLTFFGSTAPTIDEGTFRNADALREILIPEGATGYDAEHGWPQDKIKTGYNVNVGAAANGSASASAEFASEGTQIVLTAIPNEGYHFVRWETEPTVEVTDDRFTMPGEDVTVTPVFEPHDFSGAWQTSGSNHWHECFCGAKQDEGTHTYTNGVCVTCGYRFDCDIFVKTLSGDHTQLHVNSTDTVRSVKEKIKENEGIPLSLQVLNLPTSGAELEDDQFLADCGVIKDSTLHLTLRYAPGGTGAADDPYLIPDKERLEAFRYYINSMSKDGGAGQYFKLTANIDLENEPWSPIGTGYGYPFAGTFDGGDHTVSGLNINGSSLDKLGFFRKIGEGGTVKNLTVAGSVTGGAYTGGIVGENEGTVENCRNACTVSAPESHAGGIAGCNLWHGTVKNCSNTGAVTGETAGGVVGQNEDTVTVEGCSNAGPVTGYFAGGVAGSNRDSGTMKNCSNTGPVTGNYAGGIVNDLDDSTVENCSNTATVTAGYASGIAGTAFLGTIKNCYNTGAVSGSGEAAGVVLNICDSTVENCYNTGVVTGDTTGGVVITNDESVLENCYYLDACGAAGEGMPKTAAQFASGEVAYLLQSGQDPQVWGQTVGSGTPELTDSADKTVYRITGVVEGQDDAVWYSNHEATLPAAPVRPGFAFEGWSTTEGGSVDFAAGAAVSEDRTVYAIFTDKRLEGVGTVTMADYTCGDNSVNPVTESETNGTANVTFTYSVRGRDEYSAAKPTTAGEYTVKAVFAATDDYHEVTATADFKVTHQFNAGWEQREDGYYHLCACGTGLLLEVDALTQVPEGLKKFPDLDTVEEITRVLAEEVDTGTNYAVYDVKLETLADGKWVEVTAENFPAEGVSVTIPYPEGTNAGYAFTVVHMITAGENAGQTERLTPANGSDGIHIIVKSLSPVCIGWRAPAKPAATNAPAGSAPNTGDPSQPALWLAVMGLALLGLAAAAAGGGTLTGRSSRRAKR